MVSTPGSTAERHPQQQNYGSFSTSPEHSNSADTNTGVGLAGSSATSSAKASAYPSARRSVHITVPEEDDDNASIASISSYSTCSSTNSSTDSILRGSGYRTRSRKNCDGQDDDDGDCDGDEYEDTGSRKLFWTYVVLAPALVAVWGSFAALMLLLPPVDNGSMVRWDQLVAGMVGWGFAFAIRTPIYALFQITLHQSDLVCECCTLLLAGTLEELVRLGIIRSLDIGSDFSAVYWLGLGWAGIETLYYIGQSLIYTWWFSDSNSNYRTLPCPPASAPAPVMPISTTTPWSTPIGGTEELPKSPENGTDHGPRFVSTREARHLLGIDRPWWSLMGRTSSMMVHIGLSCWLGYGGWRLLPEAVVVHGSLYLIWGALMPDHWSVPATSYGTFMAAMVIFLAGLALYGEIV
ncbi:hypothetical protein BGZ99_008703 [Dissophora globulifera]|uniref:Uncharacterized protein n=1 Tax=Dissophora globulifera TaxID=979702 RepID=A0A9P6RR20_9FUNG|nr:hypothetical protein BGZ99_008703 [Dissophora globulifera]